MTWINYILNNYLFVFAADKKTKFLSYVSIWRLKGKYG